MNSALRTLSRLALLVVASCAPVAAANDSEVKLFHNGRIYLNDEQNTVATALLVKDGRVIAAGDRAEIEKRPEAASAKRVDLLQGTAVPGLQDAHGHLEWFAGALETLDLRGAPSYAAMIERVRGVAQKQKEGTWIVGRGWDQNQWADKALPHHLLLSSQVPKHPVFLLRVDGHAALVNKAALVAAKLDGVIDPDLKIAGGRVVTDDEGLASGVLLDEAIQCVEKLIPLEDVKVRLARMMRAQDSLLALGLTAVHDMGTKPATLALLKDMRRAGQLKLRVVSYIWGNGELTDESLKDLPLTDPGVDRLCIPGVKFMADGALGSRGAALFEDYSDAPGERGYLILNESELGARLALIAKRRLQPAVHAIGDRANNMVLNLYETLAAAFPELKDLRPRIEHAQVVAPKDWPRFPELKVVPSMQPVHAISDMAWAVARLGESRTRGAYAWRALAPELGKLAFGSDFPMESPNPLLGIYAARTRQNEEALPKDGFTPEQRLDARAALAGFTSGAAYACFQDDRRGRLKVGYFADLSVFNCDPITCAPSDLLKAQVLMTVIDGEVVYKIRGH
jgi:predicted amidohydrolase YtcJ